jgi:FMN reductase
MPADAALAERIARAGYELGAAIAARQRPERRDAFEDPIPFEELLRRSGST